MKENKENTKEEEIEYHIGMMGEYREICIKYEKQSNEEYGLNEELLYHLTKIWMEL